MKSNIQDLIQRIIVHTSSPPLTYLYRKIYDLSVVVATLLLKRLDGVLAIYLRRGVAKGEIVYGLSDIDLLVIVNDDNNREEEVKEKVKATYNRWSHFMPILGSVDRELGLYSVSEFLNLYKDYDFYRHWFNDGKYSWKLLFGEDVVKTLPQLEDFELYLPATEEFKAWWALLNVEFNTDFGSPPFKRKYMWYKAISEASMIYLFVCHGKTIRNREAALCEIKNYLAHEHQCYIDRIRSYLRHLTSNEALVSDKLMNLFITLAEKTFREMEHSVYGHAKGKRAILHMPCSHDIITDCNLVNLLKELDTMVREELEPYLDYIALIPQVEFDLDVLNNPEVDSYYLVLLQNSYIPIEKLRKFRSLFVENSTSRSVEPIIVSNRNIAFSLKVDKTLHCIKSPRRYPIFFSLLHRGALRFPENSFEENAEPVHCYLPPNTFEETIKKRTAKINTLISGKNIYKLRTLDFLRFFWAAARTKLLIHSLKSNRIYIPLNSRHMLERLLQSFPEDLDWLNALHTEYTKELLGKENRAYYFFSKAVNLLSHI